MKSPATKKGAHKPKINKSIEIAAGVAAELSNYLIVAFVVCVLMADLAKENPDVRSICILAVVPLLYYFLRERVHRFWLFTFLHLLPEACILLFYKGGTAQRIILLLIASLFAAGSFTRRVKSDKREMEAVLPPVAAGIFWALYLIDQGQGAGALGRVLLYGMIGYTAVYFVYFFLKQFLHYIDVNNRTTENIPVDHVFYSAAGLAGVFVFAMTAVTAAVSNKELMDRLGVGLRELLVKGISFLFSLLPRGDIKIDVTDNVGGGIRIEEMPGTAPEKSLFMEIIDLLLCTAAVIIFVLVAVKLIISVVSEIRNGFAGKKRQRQIESGIYDDRVENLKKEKKEQKKEKTGSLQRRIEKLISPEEKIRRIYRRTLEKSIGFGEKEKKALLLQKATARECCMEFFPERRGEAAAFAGLYEKARYGEGLCSSGDVGEAKRLSRKLQGKSRQTVDKEVDQRTHMS